jgi:hypothetical protein
LMPASPGIPDADFARYREAIETESGGLE